MIIFIIVEDKAINGNYGKSSPGGLTWIKVSEKELIVGTMYGFQDRRRYFDVLDGIENLELRLSIITI